MGADLRGVLQFGEGVEEHIGLVHDPVGDLAAAVIEPAAPLTLDHVGATRHLGRAVEPEVVVEASRGLDRLAEHAERATLRVSVHQTAHNLLRETSFTRHPWHLKQRGGRTEMRIEAGRGGRHQVHRHRHVDRVLRPSPRAHANRHALSLSRSRFKGFTRARRRTCVCSFWTSRR